MATKIKIIGGGDEPAKTTKIKVSKKPAATSAEVEAANQFAKSFALRRGLVSGENTHTGGQVPKFIDQRTGADVSGVVAPPIGKMSNRVPAYVTSLEWDKDANLPYYIDDKTGDTQYVDKELFYSPRFRRAVPSQPTNSIVKR